MIQYFIAATYQALGDHDEAVNNRMKSVLSRETDHDDASAVEQRLRNMVYGTNKK